MENLCRCRSRANILNITSTSSHDSKKSSKTFKEKTSKSSETVDKVRASLKSLNEESCKINPNQISGDYLLSSFRIWSNRQSLYSSQFKLRELSAKQATALTNSSLQNLSIQAPDHLWPQNRLAWPIHSGLPSVQGIRKHFQKTPKLNTSFIYFTLAFMKCIQLRTINLIVFYSFIQLILLSCVVKFLNINNEQQLSFLGWMSENQQLLWESVIENF